MSLILRVEPCPAANVRELANNVGEEILQLPLHVLDGVQGEVTRGIVKLRQFINDVLVELFWNACVFLAVLCHLSLI